MAYITHDQMIEILMTTISILKITKIILLNKITPMRYNDIKWFVTIINNNNNKTKI